MPEKENLQMKNLSNPRNLWYWPGHVSIIEVAYNALPESIKKKLDLNAMIDGSNDPDEKFKDTVTHSYPKSYMRAVKWLGQAKMNYESKNYRRASYCFGIASHYISDTFSAPHCVKKESGKEHYNIKVINDDYTPKIKYISGDLFTIMQLGVELGQEDWEMWKKSKDPSIPRIEADIGASVTYSVIKDILKSN